jgi:hypothetical protein
MSNDQKYLDIFNNAGYDHDTSLQAVVDAVREDEAKKVSHPQLMDEIQARDETIDALNFKIKGLVAALDKHHGTPCEQIRHYHEIENLKETINDLKSKVKGSYDHMVDMCQGGES